MNFTTALEHSSLKKRSTNKVSSLSLVSSNNCLRGSLTRALVSFNAIGGKLAICLPLFSSSSLNEFDGKTSLINPHFSASDADKVFPINNNSFALLIPIAAGNKRLEHPSAQKPNFMKGVVKVAESLAYTISHKHSVVTAIPTAGPLTPTMIGFLNSINDRTRR